MKIKRRRAKTIKIGDVYIGGDNPVAVQSMTKTKTADIESTISQIQELKGAGCEIVRLAIKDTSDANALREIRQKVNLPLVADIHFNWLLALKAIDNGVDKIRLNPGNIYKKAQLREIARAAKINRIPIRVGLNSGSLPDKNHKTKDSKNTAETMITVALDYINILEKFGFYDMVISLKASNILDTVEAYRRLAGLCEYPFHLGVTATGTAYCGTIKSSIALGALLLAGIGDTIRVSLTDSPQQEVQVARSILETLGLRIFGLELISCPTCGRCEIDLVNIACEFKSRLNTVNSKLLAGNLRPFKVAIMGCVVNGPGEARQADIGVAFGKKDGLLFRKGSPVKKVSPERCVDVLWDEINKEMSK